ncbi:hypothetical protein HK097_002072 [Rhizophlyctis rosea]|uniref:Uncharacterized protein n=1 Tax=Rhizophlyctis rosea TaxID=64517 RepID=A0AAD5S4S4_9FUNG|nr:hypothetical protein HK097_002072 [Rhizophlyctis rosea]
MGGRCEIKVDVDEGANGKSGAEGADTGMFDALGSEDSVVAATEEVREVLGRARLAGVPAFESAGRLPLVMADVVGCTGFGTLTGTAIAGANDVECCNVDETWGGRPVAGFVAAENDVRGTDEANGWRGRKLTFDVIARGIDAATDAGVVSEIVAGGIVDLCIGKIDITVDVGEGAGTVTKTVPIGNPVDGCTFKSIPAVDVGVDMTQDANTVGAR